MALPALAGGKRIPAGANRHGRPQRQLHPEIPRSGRPRLGEILFGLIMVLTITLTAGLTVADGPQGVRQLLFAAIGCNVAWGIIDAVMYIMNCITVRSGKARFLEAMRQAPDVDAALRLIRDEIEPDLQDLLKPEDAEARAAPLCSLSARQKSQGKP